MNLGFGSLLSRPFRLFVANDHMVQNPPCWRASYSPGPSKTNRLQPASQTLDVPVRSLLSNMTDFVPYDRSVSCKGPPALLPESCFAYLGPNKRNSEPYFMHKTSLPSFVFLLFLASFSHFVVLFVWPFFSRS